MFAFQDRKADRSLPAGVLRTEYNTSGHRFRVEFCPERARPYTVGTNFFRWAECLTLDEAERVCDACMLHDTKDVQTVVKWAKHERKRIDGRGGYYDSPAARTAKILSAVCRRMDGKRPVVHKWGTEWKAVKA